MTKNQEHISEIIRIQIASGFYPKEEIKEEIFETIEDEELELSEEWVQDEIQKLWEAQMEQSKTWINPTDVERLTNAFDDLCKQNIIALHNAGYTTTDGITEVAEIEQLLQEKKYKSDGFCFYHEQDLASVFDQDNSSLWIAFNKLENVDDKVAVEVGRKVEKTLQKYGFSTQWNGKSTQRIEIKNMNWQRIYNKNQRDLMDYSVVFDLIINSKVKQNSLNF